MGTNYTTFVAHMQDVLRRSFSAATPQHTTRSRGLDPQCGLVLGARPSIGFLYMLSNQIAGLPAAWSGYSHFTMHLTFAAVEDRGESSITQDVSDGFEALQYSLSSPPSPVPVGASPALTDVRLLFSGDTLVLTGNPNEELFKARQRMLEGGSLERITGIRPAWGMHLTLARLMRPLEREECVATNDWAQQLLPRLPDVLPMVELVAGAFEIVDDRFLFVRRTTRRVM